MEPTIDIQTTVNGTAVSASVPARQTLVDFLRYHLELTGSHVGCEHGVCGACTVLVDGQAVRSCLMLAVQADGAIITTVEGLASEDGQLHPLQQAFHDNHGLQCGFCTPGVLMTLLEFLQHNSAPTEGEVRVALSGNLCRCTGYQPIVDSIRLAAEMKQNGNQVANLTNPSSDPHPIGPDEPTLPPGDAR